MSSANFLTNISAPEAHGQSPMKVPSVTNLALLYWLNMTWGDQLISGPTTMEVPELERRPYLDSESWRQTIADVPSFCLEAEMPINEKQQKLLFFPSFYEEKKTIHKIFIRAQMNKPRNSKPVGTVFGIIYLPRKSSAARGPNCSKTLLPLLACENVCQTTMSSASDTWFYSD